MKLRILALACTLLAGATACSSSMPTEPAGLPSIPIPDSPDYDYPAIPNP